MINGCNNWSMTIKHINMFLFPFLLIDIDLLSKRNYSKGLYLVIQ